MVQTCYNILDRYLVLGDLIIKRQNILLIGVGGSGKTHAINHYTQRIKHGNYLVIHDGMDEQYLSIMKQHNGPFIVCSNTITSNTDFSDFEVVEFKGTWEPSTTSYVEFDVQVL